MPSLVIARSEAAKQSTAHGDAKLDCFAPLAMTATDVKNHPHGAIFA
jgi:hypothetical protein